MILARGIGAAVALGLAALPAGISATPAAGGVIQSYDTYKSWLLACDNTLTCVAKGFTDASDKRAEMRIDRGPGPSGPLALTIRSERAFALDGLRVDGAPLPLPAGDWERKSTSDETSVSTNRPAAIRALIERLDNGTTLTLGGDDALVSLAGLRAALLRMDDRQGRVGTTSALGRAGTAASGPFAPSPAPPKAPVHSPTPELTAATARALITRARMAGKAALSAEDCEADTGSFTAEAHALDARNALVLLPCLMGAYQGSALTFLVPRTGGGAITRLILDAPYQGASATDRAITMVTSPAYDARTGELAMFAKGRGLSDCGMSASWIWDGRRFVLTTMAMQQACGGVDPGDWPVLYRTTK